MSDYEELLRKVKDHNRECDLECRARNKYCVDYLAIGRSCPDCPRYYKIKVNNEKY